MAFIEPMHRNEPIITYLLTYSSAQFMLINYHINFKCSDQTKYVDKK